MRRFLIVLGASATLTVAIASPVAANSGSYPGCSYFGADTAGWAQASGGIGSELSVFARQGMVGAIVASEHADPTYCVQH